MNCRERLGDPLQESRPSEWKCRPMVDWHLKHLQQRHVTQWEVCLARNDWFIAPVTGVVSRGFYAHWHVWCSRFNKALYQVVVVGKDGMSPSAEKSLSGLLKNLFVSKVMVISRNCKVRYLLPGARISYHPRKNCRVTLSSVTTPGRTAV